MKNYPHVLSATTIIDDKVVSTTGDDLGTLKELMIDMDAGRINYAVLSFGGFLGMGDKLFAIPWEALSLNPEDHSFTLNVNKEQLENAPGFNKDNWPGDIEYEAGWLLDLYAYYDLPPYWVEIERNR